MSQILRNKNLDAEFKSNGFLKLNIFPKEIIEKIGEVYKKYESYHYPVSENNAFHSTQDTAPPEISENIDAELKSILSRYVEEHFLDYKFLVSSFLIKEPGPNSILPPHQDWNFTDENSFFSFNIWIPLEDTNKENGCLRFLPGAHKITQTIRPNYNYPWAFEAAKDYLSSVFADLPTKKGECVLINHAVLHGSYANLSDKPRVAVVLGIIPKEADIIHYYCDDSKTLEKYKLNREDLFYLKYGKRPENGVLLSKEPFEFPKLGEEEVRRWMETASASFN